MALRRPPPRGDRKNPPGVAASRPLGIMPGSLNKLPASDRPFSPGGPDNGRVPQGQED